jgi:putative ABC transport system substrate-binding protein
MNKRRKLIFALSAGALLPPWAAAQPAKAFRVGWLSADRAGGGSPFFDAFREGLRDLSYVEGRNLIIDARWGEESSERLAQLAAELVQSKPDVIVTQGGALRQVIKAGLSAPIVFAFSGDVVEAGFVDSLARPGRNLTGVMFLSLELVGKRIELLKEVMPGLKRIAILANPEHPGDQSELRASQTAAKTLDLTLEYFRARNAQELESALSAIAKSHSQAIVVFPDALTVRSRERIASFSAASRLPVVAGWAQFTESGSLMSYGASRRIANDS